jgi:predicted dehydrogenase
MAKLRVGIIGMGFFALISHIPNFKAVDQAEIVAIARRNPERLSLAKTLVEVDKGYTDWHEMLEKESLDAVVICTPHDVHFEPTMAALERGLHVLLEKPVALVSQEAWSIAAAAEKANRVLTVGYNARGLGSWRAVKRALDANILGQIRQVSVTCSVDARFFWGDAAVPPGLQDWLDSPHPTAPFARDMALGDTWRNNPTQMGGGMFVDSGTHILDLCLWLMGSIPSEVTAYISTTGNTVDSVVNCQGRLANGVTFSIVYNCAVAGGNEVFGGYGRLSVLGDNGTLNADWKGIMVTEAQEIWTEVNGVRGRIDSLPDTITPASAFVSSILDGAANLAPVHEAAQVVALTEAIYRSAAEHRIVSIDSPVA